MVDVMHIEEVWNSLPPCLSTSDRWQDLSPADKERLAAWWGGVVARTSRIAGASRLLDSRKLYQAIAGRFGWPGWDDSSPAWQRFWNEVVALGSAPDPHADGELLRKAMPFGACRDSAEYEKCAAEFRRLLEERDGGAA